jgi:hypothetical protein
MINRNSGEGVAGAFRDSFEGQDRAIRGSTPYRRHRGICADDHGVAAAPDSRRKSDA